MKNKTFMVLLLSIFMWLGLAAYAWAENELADGQFYTMVDEKGQVIDYTGLQVSVGDEYISPDNSRYRVERVAGLTAYARNLGKIRIAAAPSAVYADWSPANRFLWLAAKDKPVVGVYSTHTDESYTPTDGKESIRGKGGIIKVADTLTKGLASKGIKAIHDKTSHDPHDANAYNRSRKTASRLLRQGALSLIDVHRDAAPAKAYANEVEGKAVTRIKLVVGRTNPKMAANMDFAKQMKAHIDKNHPGLSAGIFVGKGNYNQDLTPRAMLIEVGAHKNERQQAQQAVSLFAGSVPEVLGVKTSGSGSNKNNNNDVKGTLTSTAKEGENKANYATTLGILAVVVILGGAFFMLNRGKVKK